jgi:hypothetical protein
MYPQLMYRDVAVGGVYHCPPGGMIFACVAHERDEQHGKITWLVLDAGAMASVKSGDTHYVSYTPLAYGSWERIG